MCGIVGTIGGSRRSLETALDFISHRGPDGRGIVERGNVLLGHVRLSVQDLSAASDQPFIWGDWVATYNGELWDHRSIRDEIGGSWATSGDTETFVAAVAAGRFELLDGMYGAAVVGPDGLVTLIRDPYGEVPLHIGVDGAGHWWWSSELKGLLAAGVVASTVRWFPPGVRSTWTGSEWKSTALTMSRFRGAFLGPGDLRATFDEAVQRRVASTDAPICGLLSGGVDSASVMTSSGMKVAYTAVFNSKSSDLRQARVTAESLGIELREVLVAAPSSRDLATVVEAIEMPHKAQVEIGWACLALARRISDDGFKVVLTGEGADELLASYGMAHHGIVKSGWFGYRNEVFRGQHRKNFARCNKVFMAQGVEARLPFCDHAVASGLLATARDVVECRKGDKSILREGFHDLPESARYKPKVAFQDGAGLKGAAASAVADPRAHYLEVFRRTYGVEP